MSPEPTQPRTWTLRLPFRTPLSLNQLYRMHWRKRAAETRAWKDTAIVLARQQRIPTLERFTVVLHYAPTRNNAPDLDNLTGSTKPLVDGLVIARVAADDTEDHYRPSSPIIHPSTGEPGRLWLDVIDLGGTA